MAPVHGVAAGGLDAADDAEDPVPFDATAPTRPADFTLSRSGLEVGRIWVDSVDGRVRWCTEVDVEGGHRRIFEERGSPDELGRASWFDLWVAEHDCHHVHGVLEGVNLGGTHRRIPLRHPLLELEATEPRDARPRVLTDEQRRMLEAEGIDPDEFVTLSQEGVQRLRSLVRVLDTLVGWSPVVAMTTDHRVGLFAIADSCPRLDGASRSFQVMWPHRLAAPERWSVRYAGVESVPLTEGKRSFQLHAFQVIGGDVESVVHLDRDGRGARLECGAGEFVLGPTRSWAAQLRDVGSGKHTERSPFSELAIKVPVTEGVHLAGVLRVPAFPFDPPVGHPAVVLIGGSGPLDRDGNGPDGAPPRGFLLRDLASALTRAGIVTLCVDERGVRDSGGVRGASGVYAQVEDAAAAYRFLADRTEVDPARVGVLGHSEGAILAALVHRHVEPAATLLLAPPTRPLGQLLPEQTRTILRVQGLPEAEVRRVVDLVSGFLEWLNAHGPHEPAPERFAPVARIGSREWWEDHRGLVPMQPLAALRGPVLILHGAQDRNVTVDQSAELDGLLQAAGVPVHRREFHGLDHFFMASANGDPMRATEGGRRVDAQVLDVLVQWATWNL